MVGFFYVDVVVFIEQDVGDQVVCLLGVVDDEDVFGIYFDCLFDVEVIGYGFVQFYGVLQFGIVGCVVVVQQCYQVLYLCFEVVWIGFYVGLCEIDYIFLQCWWDCFGYGRECCLLCEVGQVWFVQCLCGGFGEWCSCLCVGELCVYVGVVV